MTLTDPSTAVALPAGAVPLPADRSHPQGNWVVLRDYHELTGKDVKTIISAVTAGSSGGAALMQMRDAVMELLVQNWSFEQLPLPATSGITDRLPGNVLAALIKLVEPARLLALGVDVAPELTEETLNDPASPTRASSE